ncbi:unnamed protein product [Durusdinium trenchii]|uniref:Uncharacterized protein n=1 Tax=Durusdinium trenchii TaxID=1381693 RepID=A0ABP0PU33_9DINO
MSEESKKDEGLTIKFDREGSRPGKDYERWGLVGNVISQTLDEKLSQATYERLGRVLDQVFDMRIEKGDGEGATAYHVEKDYQGLEEEDYEPEEEGLRRVLCRSETTVVEPPDEASALQYGSEGMEVESVHLDEDIIVNDGTTEKLKYSNAPVTETGRLTSTNSFRGRIVNVYGGFGFLKQLGDADAQDIFFRAADVIGGV